MKPNTQHYRKIHLIDMSLDLNYRNIWLGRLDEIKSLVVTMSIKKLASYYGVPVSSLSAAMKHHKISANVERHKNKLKLNKQ